MKKLSLLVLTATVACGSAIDTNDGADSPSELQNARVHWQQGYARAGGGTSGNLIDHSGPVLAADTTYAIWWGNNPGAMPSDSHAGLKALLGGFGGSQLRSVANQYFRGATTVGSTFGGEATDTNASPTRGPSTSTIVSEACSVITSGKLPLNGKAIYFLFADNMPGHTSYCAYHTWGMCNGTEIQVAYQPNTTGVAGCDPGNLYSCNSYSQGTRSIANVTSHEYMEAITDPDGNGWTDSGGSEIGDKCAWTFSSCVNVGGSWQLQKEWSNAVSGCVQQ